MQNNETRKRKKEKKRMASPKTGEETKLFCHVKRGFVGF
jgi:hypothetical protein